MYKNKMKLLRPSNDPTRAVEIMQSRKESQQDHQPLNETVSYTNQYFQSEYNNNQQQSFEKPYFWVERAVTPYSLKGRRVNRLPSTTTSSRPAQSTQWRSNLNQIQQRPESSQDDHYNPHYHVVKRQIRAISSQNNKRRILDPFESLKHKTIDPERKSVPYNQIYFQPLSETQKVQINCLNSPDQVTLTALDETFEKTQMDKENTQDGLHEWVNYERQIKLLRNLNFYQKNITKDSTIQTRSQASRQQQKRGLKTHIKIDTSQHNYYNKVKSKSVSESIYQLVQNEKMMEEQENQRFKVQSWKKGSSRRVDDSIQEYRETNNLRLQVANYINSFKRSFQKNKKRQDLLQTELLKHIQLVLDKNPNLEKEVAIQLEKELSEI